MSTLGTWDKITGALGSTTAAFGGEWGNFISDLLNGEDIGLTDPTKKPNINTEFRFRPEKIRLWDVDDSHQVTFSVDDIDVGPLRKIRIRRMVNPNETDVMVLENQTQTLSSKTFTAPVEIVTDSASELALSLYRPTDDVFSSVVINFDQQSDTGVRKSFGKIRSLDDDRTNGIERSWMGFEYIWDGVSGIRGMFYNNGVYFGLSSTNSRVGITNSGISGSNKTFTFPNLSGQIATLNNGNTFTALQAISYDDVAQLYLYRPVNTNNARSGISLRANNSTPTQIEYSTIENVIVSNTASNESSYISFRYRISGTLAERGYFYNNGIGFGSGSGSIELRNTGISGGMKEFTFPNLAGQLATLNNANTFTALQTISLNSDTIMTLLRPANTVGNYAGLNFSAYNASSAATVYAQILMELITNTAGDEDGQLRFLTRKDGSTATKMILNKDGLLSIGPNLRLQISEGSLTTTRQFTFPDVAGEVSVINAAQTLTDKTVSNLKETWQGKSTTYTMVDSDYGIYLTGTGTYTVTLPAVSGRAGKIFKFLKTGASGTVTLDGNASETINGATTVTMTTQYQFLELVCDGSAWFSHRMAP